METDTKTSIESAGQSSMTPQKNPRLFILILICGLSIQPFSLVYLTDIYKIIYLIVNPIAFLIVALILRGKERQKLYFPVSFAFFIGSLATSLNQFIYSGGPGFTVTGKVVVILLSTILVVAVILTLTKVTGNEFASIYLKKAT